MSPTLECPQNMPDPFVCRLAGELVGLPRPLTDDGKPAIFASSEHLDFFVVFPATSRLVRKLEGRPQAFFSSRLVSGVLVLGPEVDGWDGDEEITAL